MCPASLAISVFIPSRVRPCARNRNSCTHPATASYREAESSPATTTAIRSSRDGGWV